MQAPKRPLTTTTGLLALSLTASLITGSTFTRHAGAQSKKTLPGGGAAAPRQPTTGTQRFPSLARHARDLTEMARRGELDLTANRGDEKLRRTIQVLSRHAKNNPVLVSECGTENQTVVSDLARRIAIGDVPANLRGKRLFSLELASLLSGAPDNREFERRLQIVLKEVAGAKSEIIL
ncbi:MAG: type VI secretion system ATPase TssH, partial [Pyrinomonadaceae bacterium]|nr:type VI secretion system ATPase TssH [Pyrinomonadaceae bacterium]